MTFNTIKYSVEDSVGTITLYRPDQMNAITYESIFEIVEALNQADQDDSVRVVIVTGAGKAFCAGADLSGANFDYSAVSVFAHRDEGGIIAMRIFDMKKPVIAAINGTAAGVGATMTLPMDIRIVSEKAKVGFVFASRGIINEAGSGWFLPRIVGIAKAMEWVATGRLVKSDELLSSGFATYVVPPEEVYPKAVEIATEIVRNTAPVSVALSRQLMWRMLGEREPMVSHKIESMIMQWIGTTKDAKEGIESFLEKRPAMYTMKPSEEMPPFYPWWDVREFPKTL